MKVTGLEKLLLRPLRRAHDLSGPVVPRIAGEQQTELTFEPGVHAVINAPAELLPDKLHTRLVEWKGFIHSMLTGTPLEEKDYRHCGPRAYSGFIRDR